LVSPGAQEFLVDTVLICGVGGIAELKSFGPTWVEGTWVTTSPATLALCRSSTSTAAARSLRRVERLSNTTTTSSERADNVKASATEKRGGVSMITIWFSTVHFSMLLLKLFVSCSDMSSLY